MSTGTKGKRLIVAPGPRVEIEEFNLPEPGPHQFLVRVTRSQISAGSEMNFVRHGARGYSSRPELNTGAQEDGRPLGYMTVGIVEKVGPGVTAYAPGDRVLTSGNHGSYWLVDLQDQGTTIWYAEKLDDTIPDEQAGFAILGDVALHGVRRAALQIDESVAVFGAGIVGQLTIQLARISGAYPIIAVDLYESRLAKARENGATHLVNANDNPVTAIREITAGAGAETVFHCAAIPRILQTTMEAAADRGKVVLTGSAPGTAEIGLQVELLRHELTIIGIYETGLTAPHPYWPWTRQRNRRACLRLMKSGQLRVDNLISHVVPYTQAQQMYEMMARGGEDWMGIVLKWD